MRHCILALTLVTIMPQTWAFSWQDLWQTKDQQAQALMNAGEYDKAQNTFNDPAWQATAAYRAGHYQDAATGYNPLKTPDANYNQGNALAHAGQLEAALKAYDKALVLDPNHQDAQHNRKIVEELLKKQKENKQEQDNKDQNKQDQNKQDQNKQNQDKPDQDKQDQDKPDQDKPDQDKPNQDKQDQDKPDQDKQDQDKPDQDKPDQDKQDQDKQAQENQNQTSENQTPSEREQQQAKEQWLRLIPDDPGGLMREKFLRDYLNRQHENQ